MRARKPFAWFAALIVSGLPLIATSTPVATVARAFVPAAGAASAPAQVSAAVKPKLSPPAASLPTATADTAAHPEAGAVSPPVGSPAPSAGSQRAAQAAQLFDAPAPLPTTSFLGTTGGNPPDPTGDVGPNHYVQMVNTRFTIYNKQGAVLAGPSNINTLWTGQGGLCEPSNLGDPIVVYDQLADRFVLTQFASNGRDAMGNPLPPFSECIAVAQTADPTGAYFLYEFATTNFPDYPKIGVWPDAYYMSTFEDSVLGAYAFDRGQMVNGNPATMQRFEIDALTGGRQTRILPADWDGTAAPPAGAPNPFTRTVDGAVNGGADRLEVYNFHVDWGVPGNSTFTLGNTLTPNAFDSNMCGFSRNCIPQPGTAVGIDTLANRPMWRLQYRNFGTYQAMVVNQTVDVDGADHAGIRWYELRNTGAGWSIFQQGDHSPDASHRFMGSMAMDKRGDMALGYSVSSGSVFPSLRYAGRLASDPVGTLPQTEAVIVNGTGSQTTSNRWGDYSQMSVDPVDDCTFWFTGEYATAAGSFRTQIASFRFPACPSTLICAAPPTPASVPPGYNVVVGTSGSDAALMGTPGDDAIFGLDGNDSINGLGGDDLIFGGAGNDRLDGGDGNDTICGGLGNDLLIGGSGNDGLSGDDGNDRLEGGPGDDVLFGGPGFDYLDGGTGTNQNDGGSLSDFCTNGVNVNCP